jgi:hypothetical protein
MRDLLILLVRGQRIDRRYLYLLLALIVAAPFVFDVPVPPAVVLPQTRAFYDTIEQMASDPVAKNKLVILSTNYGAGTLAENNTQTEAVMRHLMKRHLKFAIFAFNDPQGRELGQRVADSIQGQYGYEYGRDYVNFGYRPGDAVVPLLKAAVRDVPGAFRNDFRGTSLAQVPMMQGIKTVNDVGLIIEVTPSATIGAWIQFYQRTGDKPIPTLFCPTAVMAPEAFPYLKSGQLQGMLNGLAGAIEYEVLTGEKGFGTRASASLSYAHLLIIVLIVLGNAGMFAERHLRRSQERRGR